MSELQFGDTVKVIDRSAVFFGEVGTIRAIEDDGHIDVFFLHRGNAGQIHFDRAQLEKVEV